MLAYIRALIGSTWVMAQRCVPVPTNAAAPLQTQPCAASNDAPVWLAMSGQSSARRRRNRRPCWPVTANVRASACCSSATWRASRQDASGAAGRISSARDSDAAAYNAAHNRASHRWRITHILGNEVTASSPRCAGVAIATAALVGKENGGVFSGLEARRSVRAPLRIRCLTTTWERAAWRMLWRDVQSQAGSFAAAKPALSAATVAVIAALSCRVARATT